jgi:hypothetical protein
MNRDLAKGVRSIAVLDNETKLDLSFVQTSNTYSEVGQDSECMCA